MGSENGWVFVPDVTRGLKRRTFLEDGHIAMLLVAMCSSYRRGKEVIKLFPSNIDEIT